MQFNEMAKLLEALYASSLDNVITNHSVGIPNIKILCLSSRKEQELIIEYMQLIGSYCNLTLPFDGDFGYLYLVYNPAKQHLCATKFLLSKQPKYKLLLNKYFGYRLNF